MRKIRDLVVSLILILALTLGAGHSLGCSFLEVATPTTTPTLSPSPTTTAAPVQPNWTAPTPESNAPVLPDIASVVAKVKSSVVAINTEVVTYDIFYQPMKQKGAGSGWIIDKSGVIVTNNHVVAGAKSITVTLADGTTLPVDTNRVFTDPPADLAVIKVDAANLVAAKIGDSAKLRVGDWLVAIGNPLGLGISAKEGIVSRQGVSITISSGQTLYDLIETSAAINPGNSGGPLMNMSGEVIGITSAKVAEVGVEGLGYAIGINAAMPIIEALISTGYVTRPWLGVEFYPVNQFIARRYGLAVNQGVLITKVISGSPAEKAGLKASDVIVGFEDKEITTDQELLQAIRSSRIGQEVKISYWRGNAKNSTSATLTNSPPP